MKKKMQVFIFVVVCIVAVLLGYSLVRVIKGAANPPRRCNAALEGRVAEIEHILYGKCVLYERLRWLITHNPDWAEVPVHRSELPAPEPIDFAPPDVAVSPKAIEWQ